MSGFIGFGKADWCPNCGSETKNADEDGVRLCLSCGATHHRNAAGKLTEPTAEPQGT